MKYGIADHLKKQLIYAVKNIPYSFLFEETTNSQVKKQYHGYVIYWSKRCDVIVHSYCGSLFVGHCTTLDLVGHYEEFVKQLDIDSKFLLHFGMDGPNVNLSFEDKLTQKLSEVDISFLKLGSWSLHPVHSAFQKGIKQLFQGQVPSATSNSEGSGEVPKKKETFGLDDFFTDIHSFFELSTARRDDYTSLESVTGVVAEYAKEHAETRWVSMKYVAVRCLEQWLNLKEYFLKFLPKQKNFKREIENTAGYTRLKTCFADPTMEAYVAFVAFVAQDFEAFLLPFQSKDPIIHLLYPAMLSLLYGLQRKFIGGAKLSSEDLGENIRINVNAEKNVKPIRMIDMGTKAKTMFAQNMISDEGQKKFRKGCLKLFQVSVSYL